MDTTEYLKGIYLKGVMREELERVSARLRTDQDDAADLKRRIEEIDTRRQHHATAIYNLCRALDEPFPEIAIGEKITAAEGPVRYITGPRTVALGPDSEPAKSTQPPDADAIYVPVIGTAGGAHMKDRTIAWTDMAGISMLIGIDDKGAPQRVYDGMWHTAPGEAQQALEARRTYIFQNPKIAERTYDIRIDPDVVWERARVQGRTICWFDASHYPAVLALGDDGEIRQGFIKGEMVTEMKGRTALEALEAMDIIVGKASVYHAQKQLEIDDAKKDARLTPSSDDSLRDMMQQSMDVLDVLIRDVRTLQGRAGAQDQQIVAMGHQIATLFNQDAALDDKIAGTHKGAEQPADKPFGLSPIEEAALRWDYQKSPSGRTGADALFTDVIRSQIDANTRIARHQERIRRELNRSPLDDAEQRARDVTDPARRPAT